MSDPQELISHYLGGNCGEAEAAALSRWIGQSSVNAQEFAMLAFIDQRLRELLKGRAQLEDLEHGRNDADWRETGSMVLPALGGFEEAVEPPRAPLQPQLRAPIEARPSVAPVSSAAPGPSAAPHTSVVPRRHVWRAAAVFLVLALGALLWLWMGNRSPRTTLAAVADAEWEAPFGAIRIGQPLPSGALSLKRGLAKIAYASGVTLVLEGPARIEITSPAQAQLNAGKLTAVVPANAHGFTVTTPSARVVDLGTEFGVEARSERSTYVEVFTGTVEVHGMRLDQRSTGVQTLHQGEAAQLAADASGVIRAAPLHFAFARSLDRSLDPLDLVDIVAGGDGTQGRRNAGISALDGSAVSVEPTTAEAWSFSDGRFHPCPERRFVAGVFIPRGGDHPVVLDPAGHSSSLPAGVENRSWYWIWAGGSIPAEKKWSNLVPFSTVIGSVDYNTPGHGLIFMHANKGITFDLLAMRTAHHRGDFKSFSAACVNLSRNSGITGVVPNVNSIRSDFSVFVDGQLRFQKKIVQSDPPFDVEVPIAAGARYLTLVTDDGGDTFFSDAIALGDPRVD